jgi:hypothetical protein
VIAGVSIDSRSKAAVWAGPVGAWAAGYPVANLGDLPRPSQVARVTPAGGAAAFTAVLSDYWTVQIVALIHHNADTEASMRIRLYFDEDMTILRADSGVIKVWPVGSAPDPDFLSLRPYIFDAAVVCRAVRVDFEDLSGPLDIGACEIARFWDWGGVSDGVEIGFDARTPTQRFAGGASQGVDQFMPRTYNGQLDYVALKEASSSGIDFQKLKGTTYPFVVVDNYEDEAAWAHGCFFARNLDLPPMVGVLYRHDTFQFRFSEYVR